MGKKTQFYVPDSVQHHTSVDDFRPCQPQTELLAHHRMQTEVIGENWDLTLITPHYPVD